MTLSDDHLQVSPKTYRSLLVDADVRCWHDVLGRDHLLLRLALKKLLNRSSAPKDSIQFENEQQHDRRAEDHDLGNAQCQRKGADLEYQTKEDTHNEQSLNFHSTYPYRGRETNGRSQSHFCDRAALPGGNLISNVVCGW